MENLSTVTSFILTAYAELEGHRYLYFIFLLILYFLILLVNAVLIAVICIERGLHGPMYLFICNLAVNGVYGSTSLLPSMLHHLLSHNYEISLSFCLLQIHCLHTYGSVELNILSMMSYDRYVAICRPLHYHQLLSRRKVCTLITLSWSHANILFGLFFIFTVQRTFCDAIIEKVYCINSALLKLSCFEISLENMVGVFVASFALVPQLLMILFSYAQILRICLFTSKESQAKSIQTCTPHLLAVINYGVGCFFELIQSRVKATHIPYKARIFMSLYFMVIPPVINPVIYGITIRAIRVQILKLFSGMKKLVIK
ncbi:olfactory receptor 52D1-like isoform X2 [Anguilla anguilla]|uniref:olfactory receptor 52D1-like isoform X2 n=1 Tax=Anguilla anguilla TaxID=7936 RepID=UPI0015AD9ADE|nr:olfactory receptor 52D1-like isoform X2 [Anguilla anguilla]XP_035241444.1 olfactory receptor 52D1-like isoform X2 [Anguilla anguilla]